MDLTTDEKAIVLENMEVEKCYNTMNNLPNINGCTTDRDKQVKSDKSNKTEEIKKTGCDRLGITIEPASFFLGFTESFTSGVIIDLLESLTCLQENQFNNLICRKMSSEVKARVDSETATLAMMTTVLRGICPVFISQFIGPWSDTNGRKISLIIPIVGFLVCYFLYGILTLFPRVPVYLYLIPPLVQSFTGGFIVHIQGSCNYICDKFTTDERAFRFAVRHAFVTTGALLGNGLSATVYYLTGHYRYQVVFFSSSIVALTSVLYITFFVSETIKKSKEEQRNLFSLMHLKNICTTIYKSPVERKITLAFLAVSLTSEMLMAVGDRTILYLVGKSQYSWTLSDFNLYSGVMAILDAIAPIVIIRVLKDKLRIPRRHLSVLFCLMTLLGVIGRSLSQYNWLFWLSSAIITFAPLGEIWDEELFDTVSIEDAGKISALLSLFEAVAILSGPPLYSELYKYLLPNHAKLVFLLSMGLLLPPTFGSIALVLMDNRSSSKQAQNSLDDEERCTKTSGTFNKNYPHKSI